MSGQRRLDASKRWMRLLLHLYPADFREEMGESIIETYRDRCRAALQRGGTMALIGTWIRGLGDSIANGLGERARPGIRWRRTGNWGRDSQLAIRRLLRAPLFVLAMVGTLTVGLGAFAVVYAVVNKVLLAPLPYDQPDDLYFAWRDYSAIFDLNRGWLGGTDVAALDTAGGPIQNVVGMRQAVRTMSRTGSDEPSEVTLLISTPDLFDVLGERPALGRSFLPEEVGEGRAGVVVLGHDLWRERFGADSGVLGAVVQFDGEPFTVIGVADRDFHFAMHSSLGPPQGADAYITFAFDLATTNPNNGSYAGLVRARPGTSPEVMAAAVNAVGDDLDVRYFRDRGLELYPVGMKPDLVTRVRPALLVLGLAGVFLVLVLTVNLATLLLTRAAQREREFAISRALGAEQMALVRATLFEGGLLGLLGGIGGALAAFWATRMLVGLAPLDLPRREAIVVDWGIAATVVATGALLGLIAAAVPAVWATRSSLASLLSSTNVRGGGGHGRMRRGMVVVQVALSLVLLTAGGLVVRSFEHLLRAQPGFDPSGVLTLRVQLSPAFYPDDTSAMVMHERLEQELLAIPGVESVGATDALPLSADANQSGVRFPDSPANTGEDGHDAPLVDYLAIRDGYLETMGIRVLDGRPFERSRREGPREVLIDRTLAEMFYPSRSAVGATMLFDGDSTLVVGVVEHARLYDVHRDDRPQVYVPNQDQGNRTLSWVVRSGRPPESLVPDVRAAVRRADSRVAIADMMPMQDIVEDSLRQQRVSAVLIAGFALGALLLTAMGLFGVVAGAVTRRRHELAIRMALGADHRNVLRLVLGEGALLVALGVVVGVPLIWLSGKAIAGILVGISPFDPGTLGVVGLGLALVALGACYVPARRVIGIDPARTLGSE